MLRDSLTAEQLELVERGIFPHHLLTKAKKVVVVVVFVTF